MKQSFYAVLSVGLLASAWSTGAVARDQIRIVGSSTVFPFSTAVAEEFGRGGKFKTPIVESTGTGGGFKLFCSGAGVDSPDIANASRRIKSSEMDACAKNGITQITEVKFGFDGIVIANSKSNKQSNYTLKQLWLALAKEVPVKGKMVANPYKKWNEIDPSLPNKKIEVYGPPPTSGTRDAFAELVMDKGCEAFPEIAALKKSDEKKFKATCQTLREDGGYIEAGENDNLIVQKLQANASAYGIFGYSYLDQNADVIQGSLIDNIAPSFDNIAAGKYEVSRSIYFYVKNAHLGSVPGLKQYVKEFTSEKAWGDEGYLANKGLIPLPKKDRDAVAVSANAFTPLKLTK
ncbi:PstS family phosphate ABC transporter substrate-binding protein [Govanella unica]|uniref:PstS family phosphate ABC transporter substrate-binding protein n=1 Tax=Govanella unica TaxID=2975056 RepID=A0A9X3TXL1_9PROT|nr:PstS family phosphate ABC transporter substrate-binding protein [Govania unica]MDA5193616.1 PstS family phosphate ABC transporter substrate-binding protein [Govania unica]